MGYLTQSFATVAAVALFIRLFVRNLKSFVLFSICFWISFSIAHTILALIHQRAVAECLSSKIELARRDRLARAERESKNVRTL